VTFGNWVPICRFLHRHVDERFALFFMFYQLSMGIAVLRIIYGVFLHVTFRCATADEDLMIAQKAREEKRYEKTIHGIFKKFDTTGDGQLSKTEFREIAKDVRVQTLLAAMGLDIHDAEIVFDLATSEVDEISAAEMVFGFSKLKGNARSVDVGALLAQQQISIDKLDRVANLSVHIASKIGANMSGGPLPATPGGLEMRPLHSGEHR